MAHQTNYFIVFYLFIKRRNVRLYTCPSLILGRRKPMVNDEQIESHAESYTYPQKCAAEVFPPWHTTRVDYTTYPWHLLCNAIDNHFEFPTFRIINEQSVDDALCMFANAFIASAPQSYKKSLRINTLYAFSCIKQIFYFNYATIMTENISQHKHGIPYAINTYN